jgi:hypothetical protein
MTARKKSASSNQTGGRKKAAAGKKVARKAAARSGGAGKKKAARKKTAGKTAAGKAAAGKKASPKRAAGRAGAKAASAAKKATKKAAAPAAAKQPGATAGTRQAARSTRGVAPRPEPPGPARARREPRPAPEPTAPGDTIGTETTSGVPHPRQGEGRASAADVHMGHVFALRPRVNTSFNPESFREAKRQLADERYESLEEAARAVAEKATTIRQGGPEQSPFGKPRRRGH